MFWESHQFWPGKEFYKSANSIRVKLPNGFLALGAIFSGSSIARTLPNERISLKTWERSLSLLDLPSGTGQNVQGKLLFSKCFQTRFRDSPKKGRNKTTWFRPCLTTGQERQTRCFVWLPAWSQKPPPFGWQFSHLLQPQQELYLPEPMKYPRPLMVNLSVFVARRAQKCCSLVIFSDFSSVVGTDQKRVWNDWADALIPQ